MADVDYRSGKIKQSSARKLRRVFRLLHESVTADQPVNACPHSPGRLGYGDHGRLPDGQMQFPLLPGYSESPIPTTRTMLELWKGSGDGALQCPRLDDQPPRPSGGPPAIASLPHIDVLQPDGRHGGSDGLFRNINHINT